MSHIKEFFRKSLFATWSDFKWRSRLSLLRAQLLVRGLWLSRTKQRAGARIVGTDAVDANLRDEFDRLTTPINGWFGRLTNWWQKRGLLTQIGDAADDDEVIYASTKRDQTLNDLDRCRRSRPEAGKNVVGIVSGYGIFSLAVAIVLIWPFGESVSQIPSTSRDGNQASVASDSPLAAVEKNDQQSASDENTSAVTSKETNEIPEVSTEGQTSLPSSVEDAISDYATASSELRWSPRNLFCEIFDVENGKYLVLTTACKSNWAYLVTNGTDFTTSGKTIIPVTGSSYQSGLNASASERPTYYEARSPTGLFAIDPNEVAVQVAEYRERCNAAEKVIRDYLHARGLTTEQELTQFLSATLREPEDRESLLQSLRNPR